MPEYRGYGRAEGTASKRAIVSDFGAFRKWLETRPEVDPSLVVYHGRSLGGGILSEVARTCPPSGVIVESAFTSMRAMFARYLVPGFLCRHQMEPEKVLAGLSVPVLIMHGRLDRIVPVAHGRRLARRIPGARYVEFECGHNDLPPDRDAYAAAIDELLVQVRASGQPERPR
jgi:pimeloyl-ACP methyl ester carboxylesterase